MKGRVYSLQTNKKSKASYFLIKLTRVSIIDRTYEYLKSRVLFDIRALDVLFNFNLT